MTEEKAGPATIKVGEAIKFHAICSGIDLLLMGLGTAILGAAYTIGVHLLGLLVFLPVVLRFFRPSALNSQLANSKALPHAPRAQIQI